MLVVLFGSFAAKLPGRLSSKTIALAPDRRTLPDGSVIELNAGAEIAVNFTPAQRGVRLLRGEALFAVAHNPGSPFRHHGGRGRSPRPWHRVFRPA